jgi:hypothetical protein
MRRDYSSLRQGLVGAWCPSLGATGPLLIDYSEQKKHATSFYGISGVAWSAIQGGLSVSPNGSTGYYETDTNCGLSGATSAALCFWASRAATSHNVIVGSGATSNRFNVFWGSDGSVYFQNESSSTSFPNCPLAGTGLNHFVWQLNKGVSSAWINGVQKTLTAGGSSASSTVLGTLQSFRIGMESGSSRYGRGFIDDVRVYNRGLSAQEICLLASRRGIGLTPLRQRRTSASSRRLYQNVAGTWKETLPLVNDGGTWKEGAVYENVGGVWKN